MQDLSYLMETVRMGYKQYFPEQRLSPGHLQMNGVGFQEAMRPCVVSRPQGTGDYLFMLYYDPVELGSGAAILAAQPPCFIVWPPQYRQHYGNPAAPYRHSWMHLDGPWVAQLLTALNVPIDRPLPLTDTTFFENAVAAIHAEMTHPRGSDANIVRNLIDNALRALMRQLSPAPARGVPRALAEVKQYIELNYSRPLTLAGLAGRAYLSVPHFCSEFKRWYGTPAMDYVIRLRLNEARHLLQDVNLPITEVARRIGYDNLYHFSKLFKKRYGRAPSHLRPDRVNNEVV